MGRRVFLVSSLRFEWDSSHRKWRNPHPYSKSCVFILKGCVVIHRNYEFGLDFWGSEEDGSMIYPCSGPAQALLTEKSP